MNEFWMLSAIVAIALAAIATQLRALRRMGRRRPLGDEASYLARGRSTDPYAPGQFIRPPLFPWLAATCHRADGRGESRLRLLMAIATCLTVVLTAIAGWRLGGPPVALLAALLLAVQPERIVLGCHIWPESLLALLLASLCVVHTLGATPASALAAGILGCLGVLCRIDFVVVPPLLLAAWWQAQGPPPVSIVAALLAPSLIALIWTSVRNHRRYCIALPDTTWAFNLMVARRESRSGGSSRFEIEATVLETLAAWRRLRPSDALRQGGTALQGTLSSPWRFGRSIVRRLLTIVGPDTFVRQKLLPPEGAYPQLDERPRRRWDRALKIAFPLLVTVLLLTTATDPRIPESFAWPSLGLLAVAVLFHARTRYRLVAMPALALIAAQGIVRLGEILPARPLIAAAVAAAGPLLFWALLRIKCSTELAPKPDPSEQSDKSDLPDGSIG